MVQVLKGRIRDTTTTTGTGAITLANAPPQGYRSFASMMNVGDTIWAIIAAQTTGDWEEGLYTYSATNTLTRTTVYDNSLNTTALISFAAGTKDVYCVGPVAYTNFTSDPPGGRLSNSSGVPVIAAGVGAATSVFYVPYLNSSCPIYDGINWRMMDIGTGLTQTLADTTKSPAATVAGGLYDMFVWNDAGTLRCTRGPAWTNTTTRASGLSYVSGILVNTSAITNGPAANRGTYVGTIATNASNSLDMLLGGIGAGGVAANIGVWNMYNRVSTKCMVRDSTGSWNTPTAAVWRAADGSNNNRVTYVCGQAEDAISAFYSVLAQVSVSGTFLPWAGIGIDSITAQSGYSNPGGSAGNTLYLTSIARYDAVPGLGQHFVQALEFVNATGSINWTAVGGGGQAMGLSVEVRC